jgi:putative nucleotidyltransferase with HDIG domain
MHKLWQHSLVCALGSWWLARNTGHQSIIDYAYLAGLLHDIGKLYLLKAMERIIREDETQAGLNGELLQEIFSEMHVEQGCRIMDHWNLPSIYRSVIANHHAEHFDHVDSLLAIVRVVNTFSREIDLSLNTEPAQEANNLPEIDLLDMDEAQCEKLKVVMNSYREISI